MFVLEIQKMILKFMTTTTVDSEVDWNVTFCSINFKRKERKNNYPWRSVSGANEARSQLSVGTSKCSRFFGRKGWGMYVGSSMASEATSGSRGPTLRQALIKALALLQMRVAPSTVFVATFGAATTATQANWGQTAASSWSSALAPALQPAPHLLKVHVSII